MPPGIGYGNKRFTLGQRIGGAGMGGGGFGTGAGGYTGMSPGGFSPMDPVMPPGGGFRNQEVGGAPGVGSRGGYGERLWGWISDNPELAAGIIGTGASIYGAHQMGKAEDRRADQYGRQVALSEEELRYQKELDARERDRRRLAYSNVLSGRGG